jgi:hypothetical protein
LHYHEHYRQQRPAGDADAHSNADTHPNAGANGNGHTIRDSHADAGANAGRVHRSADGPFGQPEAYGHAGAGRLDRGWLHSG